MSGVDIDGASIRKGAVDAFLAQLRQATRGSNAPSERNCSAARRDHWAAFFIWVRISTLVAVRRGVSLWGPPHSLCLGVPGPVPKDQRTGGEFYARLDEIGV
jgi:hypothetical protein